MHVTNPLLMQISDRLREFAQSENPMSAVYHSIQLNLRMFREMVTGNKRSNLKKLRDSAGHKQQSWTPLCIYDTMRDLRADIAEKEKNHHLLRLSPRSGTDARQGRNRTPFRQS